jgi:hypothetical protein
LRLWHWQSEALATLFRTCLSSSETLLTSFSNVFSATRKMSNFQNERIYEFVQKNLHGQN